jgi:hypothetical protein
MKDSYLGRKLMRRLLWLGAVISAFLVSSCGSSEKKASPKDAIGDEEYRVMSAVLKEFKTEINTYVPEACIPARNGVDSAEIARLLSIEQAKEDSVYRRFGQMARYVRRDKIHTVEFFDTLFQRFGHAAVYILRDSVNGKIAYDSLHRKYGNLDYYITVRDSTVQRSVDDIYFDSAVDRSVITPELLRSFNIASAGSVLEEDKFGDSLVIDLVPERAGEMPHASWNFWQAFYRMYPLSYGLVRLSRVGFNADTTTAIIYYDRMSGPLGGNGIYLILQKREGRWEIIAQETAWIS